MWRHKNITAEGVRHKYPKPVGVGQGSRDYKADYCVGAAFLRYQRPFRFVIWPESGEIATGLTKANPKLDYHRAMVFAREIMHSNDSRDFQVAWDTLDAALTWTPVVAPALYVPSEWRVDAPV